MGLQILGNKLKRQRIVKQCAQSSQACVLLGVLDVRTRVHRVLKDPASRWSENREEVGDNS
jgi:hypothetical protein